MWRHGKRDWIVIFMWRHYQKIHLFLVFFQWVLLDRWQSWLQSSFSSLSVSQIWCRGKGSVVLKWSHTIFDTPLKLRHAVYNNLWYLLPRPTDRFFSNKALVQSSHKSLPQQGRDVLYGRPLIHYKSQAATRSLCFHLLYCIFE